MIEILFIPYIIINILFLIFLLYVWVDNRELTRLGKIVALAIGVLCAQATFLMIVSLCIGRYILNGVVRVITSEKLSKRKDSWRNL